CAREGLLWLRRDYYTMDYW
nr:immunoglobulin heavy chain junction region [Mus musculus]MBK4190035.1 immunoglobulin heavy chain junction region [Mus musculus]